MNLRSRSALARPGRYQESSNYERDPSKAPFVAETKPFNPNLHSPWNTLELWQSRPAEPDTPDALDEAETELEAVIEDTNMETGKEEEVMAKSDPGEFEYDISWKSEDEGSEFVKSKAFEPVITWMDLQPGMQMAIFREFTRQMQFEEVVGFLMINEEGLKDMIFLINEESQRHVEEDARIRQCDEAQLNLIARGHYTQEEWQATIDDMLSSDDLGTGFMNTQKDVKEAKKFLQDHRYREEYPVHNPVTTPTHIFDNYDYIPQRMLWKEVCRSMDGYVGVKYSSMDAGFTPQDWITYYQEQLSYIQKLYPDLYREVVKTGHGAWLDNPKADIVVEVEANSGGEKSGQEAPKSSPVNNELMEHKLPPKNKRVQALRDGEKRSKPPRPPRSKPSSREESDHLLKQYKTPPKKQNKASGTPSPNTPSHSPLLSIPLHLKDKTFGPRKARAPALKKSSPLKPQQSEDSSKPAGSTLCKIVHLPLPKAFVEQQNKSSHPQIPVVAPQGRSNIIKLKLPKVYFEQQSKTVDIQNNITPKQSQSNPTIILKTKSSLKIQSKSLGPARLEAPAQDTGKLPGPQQEQTRIKDRGKTSGTPKLKTPRKNQNKSSSTAPANDALPKQAQPSNLDQSKLPGQDQSDNSGHPEDQAPLQVQVQTQYRIPVPTSQDANQHLSGSEAGPVFTPEELDEIVASYNPNDPKHVEPLTEEEQSQIDQYKNPVPPPPTVQVKLANGLEVSSLLQKKQDSTISTGSGQVADANEPDRSSAAIGPKAQRSRKTLMDILQSAKIPYPLPEATGQVYLGSTAVPKAQQFPMMPLVPMRPQLNNGHVANLPTASFLHQDGTMESQPPESILQAMQTTHDSNSQQPSANESIGAYTVAPGGMLPKTYEVASQQPSVASGVPFELFSRLNAAVSAHGSYPSVLGAPSRHPGPVTMINAINPGTSNGALAGFNLKNNNFGLENSAPSRNQHGFLSQPGMSHSVNTAETSSGILHAPSAIAASRASASISTQPSLASPASVADIARAAYSAIVKTGAPSQGSVLTTPAAVPSDGVQASLGQFAMNAATKVSVEIPSKLSSDSFAKPTPKTTKATAPSKNAKRKASSPPASVPPAKITKTKASSPTASVSLENAKGNAPSPALPVPPKITKGNAASPPTLKTPKSTIIPKSKKGNASSTTPAAVPPRNTRGNASSPAPVPSKSTKENAASTPASAPSKSTKRRASSPPASAPAPSKKKTTVSSPTASAPTPLKKQKRGRPSKGA